MPENTYIATLDDGTSHQSIELELIAGEFQKSFVRPGTVDGHDSDVVWELDPEQKSPTYRIASGSGYGEAGSS